MAVLTTAATCPSSAGVGASGLATETFRKLLHVEGAAVCSTQNSDTEDKPILNLNNVKHVGWQNLISATSRGCSLGFGRRFGGRYCETQPTTCIRKELEQRQTMHMGRVGRT